jgi:hypothetical protein
VARGEVGAPRLSQGIAVEVVGHGVAAEELLEVEDVDERPDEDAHEQPGDEDLQQEEALVADARDEDPGGEPDAGAQQHGRRAARHDDGHQHPENDRQRGEQSVHS